MDNKTPILSEFLQQTDTQMRFFDLSRRVSKITLSDFQKFEQADIPYPFPYEQTAWIGLLYWNKTDKAQHNIWFLRMPLDETGHIQLSARDEFMHLLLSRFSENMKREDNKNNAPALEHVLKDNPYVYKPTEDKMAIFHAKALLILQQSPTRYFTDTLKYFQGTNYQKWQEIGLQGIADIAVRQDKKEIYAILLKSMPHIPDRVFNILCQNLENETISSELANVITKRFIDSDDEQLMANGIRALASCQSSHLKNKIVKRLLEKIEERHPLVLVAIVAKVWESLHDEDNLTLFLEKLAHANEHTELFNSLMLDLMFLPNMRTKVLQKFRDPQRSDHLSKAVGSFMQAIR